MTRLSRLKSSVVVADNIFQKNYFSSEGHTSRQFAVKDHLLAIYLYAKLLVSFATQPLRLYCCVQVDAETDR